MKSVFENFVRSKSTDFNTRVSVKYLILQNTDRYNLGPGDNSRRRSDHIGASQMKWRLNEHIQS